jgi:hypothetical protein
VIVQTKGSGERLIYYKAEPPVYMHYSVKRCFSTGSDLLGLVVVIHGKEQCRRRTLAKATITRVRLAPDVARVVKFTSSKRLSSDNFMSSYSCARLVCSR